MNQSTIDEIKTKITPILIQARVKKASLFGSYARGDSDDQSDIDILIEPPPHMGLSFIKLQLDLEITLQKKVDLVSYQGINKHLKNYVLAHQITIL